MLAVIFLVMASASLSLGAQDCGLISPNVESALSDSRTSSDGQDESTNRIIGGRNVPVEGLPWQVLHSPVVVLSGKRVKCLKTLQVWLKSWSRLELWPLFPHLGEEHPFNINIVCSSITPHNTLCRHQRKWWILPLCYVSVISSTPGACEICFEWSTKTVRRSHCLNELCHHCRTLN